MPLAYTTCMVTSGNGVPITSKAIMTVRRSMALHGYLAMNRQCGCCGVVLGATIRGTAARPSAAGSRATPSSAASVFGSSALPRGLFSCPLPFSTLALFTSFFSLFFGAKRLKIFRFLDLPKWLASEGDIFVKNASLAGYTWSPRNSTL